jgi:high-affinity iron transporter
MLQALVITLREGLEAFLIVAISLSYLRKSGRTALTAAVKWGIVVSLGVSALGGYALYHAANQEWLEGPLALVAAVSVTWMVVHMWRVGRRMKGDIEHRLQSSSLRPGTAAFTGVFLFTVLMVSREGIETSLLLMQIHDTVHLMTGAVVGMLGAVAIAWLWTRYGRRVNLALFFQVTAIFLFVFVVQLLIQGTHEMAEQNFLPYSETIHTATESWGPDSPFGHLLTYLLVLLPLGWMTIKAMFSERPVFQHPAGAPLMSSAAPGANPPAVAGIPSDVSRRPAARQARSQTL